MNFVATLHLVVALTAAPLLLSTINRVKARIAGRRGQPLLQPYFDLARLLRKGAVYGERTTWLVRLAPVAALGAVASALAFVPFGGGAALLAFDADFVLFAYLLAAARVATIVGALDTGSSFEGMGASREAAFGALAEPALLLAFAALVLRTGGLSLSAVLYPAWPVAGTALLVLGALAIVFVAENARLPVDDPNTHLELTMVHEVMVLDHGGPDLAFIHYASALKLWLLAALMVGLVAPPPDSPPWLGFPLAVAGMVFVAVAMGVVESLVARLRMRSVPQFLLSGSLLAAVAVMLEIQ